MQSLPPHRAESILRGPLLDDTPVAEALHALAATRSGVARLLDLAAHDDAQIAWLGVEGLARSRPSAGLRWAALATFAQAARGRRTAVRRAAIWGALEIGLSPLTREALRGALGDRDATVRTLAAHGLGADPLAAPLQFAALRPLFDVADPDLRARAYDAAGATGLAVFADALNAAIALESAPLADRAAIALGRIDPTHARPAALAPIFEPWRSPVRPQTHRRLRGPLLEHPDDARLGAAFCHDLPIDDARLSAAATALGIAGELSAMSARSAVFDAVVRPRYASVCRAAQAPAITVAIKALIEWATSGLESAALTTEPEP